MTRSDAAGGGVDPGRADGEEPRPLGPPPIDGAALADATARFTARAGAEVPVAYALVDSPIGRLVAAATPEGLVQLAYEDFRGGLDAVLERLAARLSPAILEVPARLDAVRRELDEYFAGRRTAFDVPLDWSLTTPFAERVLRATSAIGFGQTRTYGQVAAVAGNARASRAAGRALGSNPIPIIVPCHRVVGGSGR